MFRKARYYPSYFWNGKIMDIANFLKRGIKIPPIFLFLSTMIIGVFLLSPYRDFQLLLAQGDHGRDLYAFEQTLKGAKPYKDYLWVYGPLMPYYYSLFYKFFGVTIHSILLGKMILQLSAGALFYLALTCFVPALISMVGTVWFWTLMPDFFYTYNHWGGIVMLLALILSLFLYIKNPRLLYLGCGLMSILVVSMIKINFGAGSLAAFVISVFLIDLVSKNPRSQQKRYFYLTSILLIPSIIAFVYWLFLKGLPVYVLRQCLPYLRSDQPFNASMGTALIIYGNTIWYNIKSNPINIIFAVIFNLCILQTAYVILKEKLGARESKHIFLVLLILVLFSVMSLNEFLRSGVFYRTYWSKPFDMLCMFVIMAVATGAFNKIIRFIFYVCILAMSLLHFIQDDQLIRLAKIPSQYFELERGKVYLGNRPEWIDTVRKTTEYLKTHLKENETFFALAYDPLYYFLTGRTSPTRQLAIFKHANIPPEQEQEMITQLEEKKVNFVVLSNRAFAVEDPTLGVLGQTYCRLLAQYLNDHFKVVATFGDWQNPAGWGWNHGTKILERQ